MMLNPMRGESSNAFVCAVSRHSAHAHRARPRRRPQLEQLDGRVLLAVVVPGINTVEGALNSGEIATFLRGDINGTIDQLSSTVTWGDGQSDAATIQPDATNADLFHVLVPSNQAHAYAKSGPYSLGVSIKGAEDSSNLGRGTATVAATPITAFGTVLAPVLNKPFSGVVAAFQDPNPLATAENFVASIEWGDGSNSAGQIAKDAVGQYQVSATHTYTALPAAPDTSYSVRVIISKNGTSESKLAISTARLIVQESFTLTAVPLSVKDGQAFKDQLVGVVKSGNTTDSAADFTAVLTPSADNSAANRNIRASLEGSGGTIRVLLSGDSLAAGVFAAKLTVIKLSTGEAQAVDVAVVASPLGGAGSTARADITGALAAFSDTGKFDNDGITATPFPTFAGTAAPYSVVLLYGRRFDHKQATLLGRVVTRGDGKWQLTVGPLPDGRYTITAEVAVPGSDPIPFVLYGDRTPAATSGTTKPPLVIDTIGLSIVAVQRVANRKHRRLLVYFTRDFSGFNQDTINSPENYVLQNGFHNGIPLRAAKSVTPWAKVRKYDVVAVGFRRYGPTPLVLAVSNLQDIAGNPLAGTFPVNSQFHRTRILPYN